LLVRQRLNFIMTHKTVNREKVVKKATTPTQADGT